MKFTNEQNEAINSVDKNTIVSASAGSGKTTIMMERMSRLMSGEIVNKPVAVQNMLIVTFTNESAKDLKIKSAKKLKELLVKETDPKKQEEIKEQIEMLPLASISTIHTLCSTIIRNNAAYLDVDPTFSVMEESESKVLLTSAISKVMEDETLKADELFDVVSKLVPSFFGEISKLYEYVRVNVDMEAFLSDKGKLAYIKKDVLITDFLRIVRERLKNRIDEIDNTIDYLNEKNRVVFAVAINNLINMKNIINDYYLHCDLDGFKTLQKIDTKNVSAGQYEEEKKAYSKVREKTNDYLKDISTIANLKTYNDYDKQILEKLFSIIRDIDETYSALKKKENKMDFADLEHYAVKALKNEEIVESLRAQYKYIFVDEYQDVNIVQEELMNIISNGKNLFMVGDVKQSIYSFRHTDPTIFVSKSEEYKNDEEKGAYKTLCANYRSRKEILDFCNTVFNHVITKELSGIDYKNEAQLKYGNTLYDYAPVESEIEIACFDKEDTANNVLTVNDSKVYSVKEDCKNQLDNDSKEAQYIANKILKLVNNNLIANKLDKLISDAEEKYDKKDLSEKEIALYANQNIEKYTKKIEYKDIAILVRSKKNIDYIIQELNKRGIPVDYSEVKEADQNTELKLLVSLLSIIDNPKQDVDLISILLSVFGGFSQEELMLIRDQKPSEIFFYESFEKFETKDESKDKAILEKIDKFKTMIFKYSLKSKCCSVSNLLEEIIKDNYYDEYMLSKENGSSSLFQVRSFINSLNGKSYNMSLSKFLRVVKNNPSLLEIKAAKPADGNCVTIMTIHKSKGLQYPVIFLANAAKKFNEDKDSITKSKKYGVMLKKIDKDKRTQFPSQEQKIAKELDSFEEKMEELRLLYVALTRAQEYLYITASNRNKDVKSIDSISSYMDVFDIVKSKEEEFEKNYWYNEEGDKYVKNDNEKPKIECKKLEEDEYSLLKEKLNIKYGYQNATNEKFVRSVTELNKIKSDEQEIVEEIKYKKKPSKNSKDRTNEGSAYHHILELIDFKLDTLKEVKDSIEEMCEIGAITEEEQNTVDAQLILDCLHSEILQFAKNKKTYREQKFKLFVPANEVYETDIEDKIVVQGIADLIIEENEGSVVLVDYKFSEEDPSYIIDTYKEQLNLYQKAIELCMNKNVSKKYIYLIKSKTVVEID